MATGGPEATCGVQRGCVLAHPSALPPRLVLHTANVLQVTGIHAWGRDTATVQWLPPEGQAAQLTDAHFRNGGPTYDIALSLRGDISGPLLLMLSPTLQPRYAGSWTAAKD